MRDLVDDRQCRAGRLVERRRVGVEEQPRLSEGDAAQVLHRAEGEVGERDEVALLAGIRDAVVVLEELDRERADVERELREMAAPGHVRDPHCHSARVDRLGHLERADDPRDQIGRYRDRRPESDPDVSVGQFLPVDLGAVGQCEQSVGHHERDREHRFELGFVEAREGATGMGRLELRGRQDALGPRLVEIGAAVEAEQTMADRAVELQLEDGVAGQERPLRGDHDVLAFRVDAQVGGHRGTALAQLDQGHVEAFGVQHDRVGRLGHLQGDDDLAGKRGGVQVGGDQQLVAAGARGSGEATGLVHRGRSVGPPRSLSGVADRDRYTKGPGRHGGARRRASMGAEQWRQRKQTT